MNPTDAQILACNGDPDEPIISGPDADLIAFARAVLSLADDPHKVEREAHFALQDRMFFRSENPRVRALQDAIEGELDGLGISNEKAEAILRYVDVALSTKVCHRCMSADGRHWDGSECWLCKNYPIKQELLSDKEIERIAGRDELTGDAILRFARDLLAVASGAKS